LKRTIAIFGFMCIHCTGVAASADRDSLKGLTDLKVVVKVSTELQRDGISEDQIRADVELKLRSAGVQVPETEKGLGPGEVFPFPFISVSLTVTKLGGMYACFIDLDIHRNVVFLDEVSRRALNVNRLDEDPATGKIRKEPVMQEWADLFLSSRMASIWSEGLLVAVGATRVPSLRARVKDLIDEFLNDWLSANEKPASARPAP